MQECDAFDATFVIHVEFSLVCKETIIFSNEWYIF